MRQILTYFFGTMFLFLVIGFKPTTRKMGSSSEQQWVDSVFSSLTIDQKIGQLFMVATYSNRNETYNNYVEKLLQNYHLGGLIFFQGNPHRQAQLTNRYQALSKVPLFIGIDGEWGLGMRLDSVADFRSEERRVGKECSS